IDLRIRMGSAMSVIGPTNVGKSVFIMELLNSAQELFDIPPQRVFWCYGHKTAAHDLMTRRGYHMIQGIPTNFDFITPNSVIVLDDLMIESKNMEKVDQLFTVKAHHVPCFVICTRQNLFYKGHKRDRDLNCQYFVLFNNNRDKMQIEYLSRQMFPSSNHFLRDAFMDATKTRHSYLLIDLHTETPQLLALRAKILPKEAPMVAYIDRQTFGDLAIYNFQNGE